MQHSRTKQIKLKQAKRIENNMLPTIQPGRDLTLTEADSHAAATFFKCISWQVEETLDLLNCPYHYVCETTYPANYPPYVDILVLLFATASYLVTLVIVATTARSHYSSSSSTQRTIRYLLPCGPISLPLVILTFAKGPQINTLFPISSTGPAILHLVLISALVFDSQEEEEEEEEEEEDEKKKKKDLRYALFAASTVSGILHASLYLDYVVVPYYTGLDAMKNSRLSGECDSCVCRKEELVVGGKVVRYRAWSLTTFMVVGVLCFRIICRIAAAGNNRIMLQRIKGLMERLSWLFIFLDCVYLAAKSPHHHHHHATTLAASFGAILLLILLHLLKQASFLFSSMLPFPTHLIVNRNSLVKPL